MNKNIIFILIAAVTALLNILQLVLMMMSKSNVIISDLANISAVTFILIFLWWGAKHGKG
ncbi:hypothetical protein OKN36_22360 [Furfurilactobacillus sp. OKN36]